LFEISYQALLRLINDDRLSVISEANKSKAEMTDYYTLWAHQIKTPIAAAQLLLSSERLNKYAIEGELFKIEQYTEMVLHYLRLESISNDMVLKKYNLYDIVCQALKKYSVSFAGSGLSLNFEKFDCTVITDEKWMVVVVEQILSIALSIQKAAV
jgi:signal transduction histidine kinase